MIEPDLTELVDDDDGAGERLVLQQAVEKRGLAGAEEAGQHSKGNGLGGCPQVAGVAGAHFFWGSVFASFVFALVLLAAFVVFAFVLGAAGRGAACGAVDCVAVACVAFVGAAAGRGAAFGFGRGVGTPSSGLELSSGPASGAGVALAIAPLVLLPGAGSPGFLVGPVYTTTGSPRRASCCSRPCLLSGARSADRNTE